MAAGRRWRELKKWREVGRGKGGLGGEGRDRRGAWACNAGRRLSERRQPCDLIVSRPADPPSFSSTSCRFLPTCTRGLSESPPALLDSFYFSNLFAGARTSNPSPRDKACRSPPPPPTPPRRRASDRRRTVVVPRVNRMETRRRRRRKAVTPPLVAGGPLTSSRKRRTPIAA